MGRRGLSTLAATAVALAVVFCVADAKNFTLGFLPALSGNKGQNKYFVGALVYALKHINANEEVLAGHNLDYVLVDNKADTLTSIRGMTKQYFDETVAFIGPDNTCATEARVAAAWNLPMVAYVSTVTPSWGNNIHGLGRVKTVAMMLICLLLSCLLLLLVMMAVVMTTTMFPLLLQ